MSLELRAITKTFGDLTANDSINLKVAKGEIHAILGENGAGKSTLMNIVYGLLQADSGSIWVDGNEVKINEPSDALNVGIGMVHQHFMLVPVFTVAENIVLGHETSKPMPRINVHFLSTNFLIFGPYSEGDDAGKYSTVDAHPFFLEAVAPAQEV